MPAPRHARIGFYTARPGDLDHVLDRARDEVIPMLESETGFRRYTMVRTGPDRLVSITGWDTHEEAQMAARRLSAWVAEVMGPTLIAVENEIAEVTHLTEVSPGVPAYGRIATFQFKPGRQEAVRERVEMEFVPLVREQGGFVRYVVFRTGPERVLSFMGFTSREAGEEAAAAIEGWVERNIAADIAAVERHAGEVVWSVRKD